eukprot:CAMPEP_0118645974 /NCGR_PEP_ID=MMETSP0785-20121206/7794_1 /TAXON_ID=91992 /ORGANISM="Bolidomonas pacifica, Strain CCMP 1866" /LENGTH=208 /DNA_ID=CAMNT_0006537907 /DNA_START=323 /DNA_END=945 /DNA_ORIENTATION=+
MKIPLHLRPRLCPNLRPLSSKSQDKSQHNSQHNSQGKTIESREERLLKRHQKSYGVKSSFNGPVTTCVTDTGHVVKTDVPKLMGGSNLHPQPVELLLSSLLGCTTTTSHYISRNWHPKPFEIIGLEMDVKAHRDNRGVMKKPTHELVEDFGIDAMLQRVTGVVTIFVSPLTEDIDSIDVSKFGVVVEDRCPVANMIVKSGCVMDVEWV